MELFNPENVGTSVAFRTFSIYTIDFSSEKYLRIELSDSQGKGKKHQAILQLNSWAGPVGQKQLCIFSRLQNQEVNQEINKEVNQEVRCMHLCIFAFDI